MIATLAAGVPEVAHGKPKKPAIHASTKARTHQPTRVRAKPNDVRFLGFDPHGPLALVRMGKVTSPSRGACRSWGVRGSRWRSLDSLGRVVGEIEVVGGERYDATNCDQLEFRTRRGKSGAGVYVSKGYSAIALKAWSLTAAERSELELLMRARDATLPHARNEKKDDLPLERRLLAWKTPGGEEQAVVGGRAVTVLRREMGRWKVLHEIKPDAAEVGVVDMYRPLCVLDMNGDGKAEIVIHQRGIGEYSDFTLTRSGSGYRSVEAGIFGGFA